MAKKTDTNDPNFIQTVEPTETPDGYSRVNAVGAQAWFKPSKGAIVEGELLGRYQRKNTTDGKPSYYYQIRLVLPCQATRKGADNEVEDVTCEPGEVVNVGEKDGNKDLKKLCNDSKNTYNVRIVVLGWIKIPNTTHTCWKFDIFAKSSPKTEGGDIPEDDIPF